MSFVQGASSSLVLSEKRNWRWLRTGRRPPGAVGPLREAAEIPLELYAERVAELERENSQLQQDKAELERVNAELRGRNRVLELGLRFARQRRDAAAA
jgi:hypothetical protein